MEIDEEYIDKVKSLIEQKDAENVKTLLTDLHPADIAELCNDLGLEEARFVYRLLDCRSRTGCGRRLARDRSCSTLSRTRNITGSRKPSASPTNCSASCADCSAKNALYCQSNI